MLYVEPDDSGPEIYIDDVYPPERFDVPSRQLRTGPIPQKYYNLNRFKIIDGIIELSLVAHIHRTGGRRRYPCAKLLVGRQASNRRQTPEPWCQFAESFEPGTPHADFIAQYEAGSPAADGSKSTRHRIFDGYDASLMGDAMSKLMLASVRQKEI